MNRRFFLKAIGLFAAFGKPKPAAAKPDLFERGAQGIAPRNSIFGPHDTVVKVQAEGDVGLNDLVSFNPATGRARKYYFAHGPPAGICTSLYQYPFDHPASGSFGLDGLVWYREATVRLPSGQDGETFYWRNGDKW